MGTTTHNQRNITFPISTKTRPMSTMGRAWKYSKRPFRIEQELAKDGLFHIVSARHSTSWMDVVDEVTDAASMGDEEAEAACTRTMHISSSSKEDGRNYVTCDGQGWHRKIIQYITIIPCLPTIRQPPPQTIHITFIHTYPMLKKIMV